MLFLPSEKQGYSRVKDYAQNIGVLKPGGIPMTTATATAENVTANDNNQTNGATAKVTPFPDRLLAEEEAGFFAAFEETVQILDRLQSLMGSKKKEIHNHIYENVWLKTPIASRAVVCLYRAEYCNTLMYSGLNKKVESDKRTFNVLEQVRDAYLDLHDRCYKNPIFPSSARKKTAAKIELFLERRFQGKAESARVRATAQEMLPPILAPLRDIVRGMSKYDKEMAAIKEDLDHSKEKIAEEISEVHRRMETGFSGLKQEVEILAQQLKETQALLAQQKQVTEVPSTPEEAPAESKPTPTTAEPTKKSKAS